MKISVDDVELYTLTDTQKNVIKYDIPSEIFDADMKARVVYYSKHKYDQCYKRLKAEWDSKLLAAGVETIPTDPTEYAELVFSQPDYKDKSTRNAEDPQP